MRRHLENAGTTKTMRAKRVEFRDIKEIKALADPPAPVKLVMKVMCILFGVAPTRKRDERNRPYDDYWEPAKKKLLADPYFCTKLHHFPRPLAAETRSKLAPYLEDPEMSQERLCRCNMAAAQLHAWITDLVKDE
jgi:dynein heavy chain